MMPAKSNEDLHIEHCAETALRPIYSQPWWRGVGNGTASSMVDHSSSMVMNGAMQAQTNARLDGRANFNKEFRTTVESQSDGNSGSENQHTKSVSSSVVPAMGQHVDPNSQMELVGHSIVMSSYPYADPQYGGMLTPYVPQTMLPPHFYGMHPGRMPLPPDMEEEPVYVNAKQYHGILRRRQSRAKAELEKKLIKARKPYLHESRHLHALRRARGCGGRFLNKKKQDDNDENSSLEKGMNYDGNHSAESAKSGFECCPNTSNGNFDSSNVQQDRSGQWPRTHSHHTHSNGNGNGHGPSSAYPSTFGDSKESVFLGQQRENMQLNGLSRGAIPSK
ncbi:hypothetical protein C1H46_006044 [Malus baccata]|uniref:Nuclear transcription factor Y subunit n=1 Tax=Malus baccata TaxID=106549 RepID=A0A540NB40_MALBA|nr:hypothetical protein C1H46_006044 [Malus baccata]